MPTNVRLKCSHFGIFIWYNQLLGKQSLFRSKYSLRRKETTSILWNCKEHMFTVVTTPRNWTPLWRTPGSGKYSFHVSGSNFVGISHLLTLATCAANLMHFAYSITLTLFGTNYAAPYWKILSITLLLPPSLAQIFSSAPVLKKTLTSAQSEMPNFT
jgi:hypothetical protein